MVVKEQKAEMEGTSKNPNINLSKHHQRYNRKSIQKVIEAQKQRRLAEETETDRKTKKDK